MSEGFEITGPGENDDVRLVNQMRVTRGSVLHCETGEATVVLHLDVQSRSLASPNEVAEHTFIMELPQSAWLGQELIEKLMEIDDLR